MAILTVLQYPDPRLKIIASPVQVIDDDLKRMIDDMYETMYAKEGLGLAGTQVNIHKRIFTMDLSKNHNEPVCVINPEILSQSGTQDDFHGCLSVGAGISDKILRALILRIRSMTIAGEIIEWDAKGLAAICVQHEVDHLNGKLFIEHLSKLKLQRIHKKIEKYRRLHASDKLPA